MTATPPHHLGRPSAWWPRRRAVIVAAAAFAIAAAAATTTALALTSPATPAQHTITVVALPPKTYSSAEIQTAKDIACTAWDQAARIIASAGKSVEALADSTGGSSPETRNARTSEKLVATAQIATLRTQIGAATPPEVLNPVRDWSGAQIDSLHGTNIRNWDAANATLDRGNDLVDVIDARCGFS